MYEYGISTVIFLYYVIWERFSIGQFLGELGGPITAGFLNEIYGF